MNPGVQFPIQFGGLLLWLQTPNFEEEVTLNYNDKALVVLALVTV